MLKTKGLEGVVATTSSVSSIENGVLTYGGYNIEDLAVYSSFEEVIYLLWNNQLPTPQQLIDFNTELNVNASIPDELIAQMKQLPLEDTHPMAILRTCISILGLYDKEADNLDKQSNIKKAVRLQAKLPTIVAAYSRICDGEEPVMPKSELSLSANSLYMLTGNEPDQLAVQAFNKALVLHADHELNASTFTSRVCVATLSDIYSGITAALGALKGPLHGGANEQVMKMLIEIDQIERVEPYLQRAFDNKEKIMGFGHRVYKDGDPRTKYLREMSKQLAEITGEDKWYQISTRIETILKEEKGLLPNVDFYSATVYHYLKIPYKLFTPIFAISRISGWIAHIMEQYENNRLIRPRADYVGLKNQTYIHLKQR